MKKRSKKKEYAPGVVLLAAGILMIIMGVLRTEHATVLLKAVNICMECIGIG
ncbi:MAG: CD1871A family CXXC motif-containing protein [Lachnospiraceae bacterium]|nr:CD1871A family CXXC motif-containing protein [Lachnospiraceae bacterium]